MADGLNKDELLQDIATVLKDEFVAQITKETDAVLISFLSGQKFKLELTEM